MTPGEKKIVKSLVAVAWADGRVEAPEEGVLEGLLCGFSATEAEEQEILAWAKQRRTLDEDIPLRDLSDEDRELLLANAALMVHVDGHQSETEREVLNKLVKLLGFDADTADRIIRSARDGALNLGSSALEDASD